MTQKELDSLQVGDCVIYIGDRTPEHIHPGERVVKIFGNADGLAWATQEPDGEYWEWSANQMCRYFNVDLAETNRLKAKKALGV